MYDSYDEVLPDPHNGPMIKVWTRATPNRRSSKSIGLSNVSKRPEISQDECWVMSDLPPPWVTVPFHEPCRNRREGMTNRSIGSTRKTCENKIPSRLEPSLSPPGVTLTQRTQTVVSKTVEVWPIHTWPSTTQIDPWDHGDATWRCSDLTRRTTVTGSLHSDSSKSLELIVHPSVLTWLT